VTSKTSGCGRLVVLTRRTKRTRRLRSGQFGRPQVPRWAGLRQDAISLSRRYLHDYFRRAEALDELSLLAHRRRIGNERPALSQCAVGGCNSRLLRQRRSTPAPVNGPSSTCRWQRSPGSSAGVTWSPPLRWHQAAARQHRRSATRKLALSARHSRDPRGRWARAPARRCRQTWTARGVYPAR